MRSLSFYIVLLLAPAGLIAQSPHGSSLGNKDCSNCHISSTWKVDKEKMEFNHDETEFKLSGQHSTVDCASCHKSLVFSEARSNCLACHNDIHQNTVGPDCERCHSTNTWIVININQIHQLGRFPLVGAHQSIDCQRCHKGYNNLNFQPIGANCFSCHSIDYYNTNAPNHAAAGYSTDCESCHSVSAAVWVSKNVNHDFFPLTGGHKIDNCFACHKQNTFAGLSINCVSCHLSNYNNTSNPNHAALKMSIDCISCHTITSFNQSTFNHAATGFVLSGKHASISCTDCHVGSANLTTTDCVSCHQANFNTAPNHVAQSYPTDCTMCHSTANWTQSNFNHAATPFPLTGAHTAVNCVQCHQNGYTNTPTACVSCHQTDFNNTNNPGHTSLALSTDCSTCHTTTAGWVNALFPSHNTYFALTGAHATTATCATCHNGNFTSSTPTICSGCHQSAYNSATNPNHSAAGIPLACETCHNSIAWVPSTFSHTATGFALTGQHLTIQCSSCHVGKVTGLNALCVTCHQSNYNTALNHISQSYPTTCEMCHNTTDWTQSTFNHSSTAFPLTGAHSTVTCNSCHTNGFGAIPVTCVSCHQTNYNGTNNPNHTSLNLSATCETCHTTAAGWAPATFPVHNTYYVLAGFHTTLACATCHTNNNYNGTIPSTCVGCHQTDYNNTTNPNHAAAQFPTDCGSCHTQTAWTGATFNHDAQYFPIYSGNHNNRWTLCSQCHQDAANFATFTCMSSGCHAQTSTNNNHRNVSGYVYTASACYSCHSRGSAGKALHRTGLKIN